MPRTTHDVTPAHDAGAIFRAGYVAIIGRANVGKSTLLNQLLRRKLSIVSPRPHTTLYRILGVVHGVGFQVAFLDTPGYADHPRNKLDTAVSRQWTEAMEVATLAVLVVEPRPPGDVEKYLMGQLHAMRKPAILAVNKIDTVAKVKTLPVLEQYSGAHDFLDLVPVSALKQDGVNVLLDLVVKHTPESEPLFPPDTLTDRSAQFLVAEVIREKVYQLFGEEIPYQVAVTVEEFRDGDDGHSTFIGATIHVERESLMGILVGSHGRAVKEVGTQARRDIEEILGRSAYVALRVKRRHQWRRQARFVQNDLGYREG